MKRTILKSMLIAILCIILLVPFILLSCSNKVTGITDSYVYSLPFKPGTAHKVVQGYGGLFSHSHQAALDFAMPIGTEIYAARGGTVYAYRDQSNSGGLFVNKRKANFIMIRHDDGSFGCYWHLKQNGVLVKHGHVDKGQLIALSGNTGFTLRPHLHFSVKRILNYNRDSYVRTKFQTNKGVIFLSRGKTYRHDQD